MKTAILIVEDEGDIADSIVYALTKEGYESVWAPTAAEARGFLGDRHIDLIILDVGLPDQSGFEFIKQIRKLTDVPVVFLTARSEEVDRIIGFELGADDYVVKPFSPRELTARIKAILKRSKPGEQASPFQVDARKQQIKYFGTALGLSRYEYKILQLLTARPGWIYSREKIMDFVWDEPEESYDRTVDTHIKTIRSKLKAVRPDIDPIITHRGMGYSLNEFL